MKDRTLLSESLRHAPAQIAEAAERVQEVSTQHLAGALLVLDDHARASDWLPAYAQAVTLLEQQQHELKRLHQQVIALRQSLIAVAEERQERERYTEPWWQHIEAELRASSGARWQEYLVRALTDWRFDACVRLLKLAETATSLAPIERDLIGKGVTALESGDYASGVHMLLFLASSELQGIDPARRDETRASLHVLIGRLYADHLSDASKGRAHLERAVGLAPGDGRNHAALGAFLLEADERLGVSHLRRAIELAPDRAEGYVGMGLLAERHELWSEANTWFDQAAEKAVAESDPVQAIKRVLAPNDGNMLCRLARLLWQARAGAQALAAADAAIELGMKGAAAYPQAPAYRLRGEILEAQADVEQAAAAYHEAAKFLEWSEDYEGALELFRKVRDLNPSHAENYWYLSHMLYRCSFTDEYPFVKMQALQECIGYWDEGERRQDPGVLVWPLLVRSLVCERQAAYLGDEGERQLRLWQALIHVERAVLLQPSRVAWYSHLSRAYRFLDLISGALSAAETGLALDPNDVHLLREKGATLADWGDYTEALAVLDRGLELGDPDPSTLGIRAFAHRGLRAYQEGFDAIQQAIERAKKAPDSPISTWDLEIRASCLLMLGQREAALRDYRIIWERHKPDNVGGRIAFITAAYQLDPLAPEEGLLAKAAALAEQAIAEQRGRTGPSAEYGMLGVIRLEQNRIDEAKDALAASLHLATRKHELFERMHVDYRVARERAQTWPHGSAALAVLDEMSERCRARLAELQLLPWADELASVLPARPEADETAMLVWSAVSAGLARHDTESKLWTSAARRYAELGAQSRRREQASQRSFFPEHERGLLGALDALQAQGRAALEAGRFGDAAGDLARVLELRSFEDPAHARVLHALCGSAALGQGDLDGARRHFVAALRPSPKDPDGFEPGALVAQICSAAMPGAAHFWALHDALQSFAAASEPAELRQELDSARRALDLNAVYRLGGDAGQALMPVVTPIAVEIGNLLVAQSGDPAGRLIDQYLPGMRERIHASMGVKLPGTRIRANGDDLPAELYVIMLDEVPIVSGSVQTRKRFAPVDEASLVAAGVPSDVLDEAALPGTSRQGCWVAEAGWDAVAEHGFELWPDPMLYMVHHLESLLRENLILFFGMQEARELVEQWSAAGDTGLAALTSKDVFRLSRLLRELVREGVPITRGPDIVDELRRADATGSSDLAAILATRPLEELLRVVRMRLRAFLPGNRAGDVRARLPPAIEARIAPFVQVDGSKHFLAMLPEETQALLTDIRELVESNPDVTLVTSSSLLRPMVRRLVSIEWPRMMVIASEELVDPEGGTHA